MSDRCACGSALYHSKCLNAEFEVSLLNITLDRAKARLLDVIREQQSLNESEPGSGATMASDT